MNCRYKSTNPIKVQIKFYTTLKNTNELSTRFNETYTNLNQRVKAHLDFELGTKSNKDRACGIPVKQGKCGVSNY